MKVAGEHTIKVSPLDGEQEATPMLAELAGSKRIDASRTAHYKEIAELCGGIPLTLRLAAARLRLLEPEELILELKQSTTLLRAELPDLEHRHRDLNRMLRLTISSLSQEDAKTLLYISLFPGGVTRAIVRRMVGSEVDDVLERLLDSALIWLDDDVSPLRFRLLEPIRQFVLEESSVDLRNEGKKSFVTQMAKTADQFVPVWDIRSDTQNFIFRMERENLRQSFVTAIDIDLASAQSIFQALWHYDLSAGRIRELTEFSTRLEATPGLSESFRGHIALCQCWCRAAEGKLDDAASFARKSKDFFDRGDDPSNSCFALASIHENERHKLDWDQVKKNYSELIDLATHHAPNFLPILRIWRGVILCARQEWKSASQDLESGYEISKNLGSSGNQINSGLSLITIDFVSNRLDRVKDRIAELRKIVMSLDHRHYTSIFLRTEARVALLDRDFEEAEKHARHGLNVFSFAGNALREVELKVSLARALIGQDKLVEGEQIVREMAPSVSHLLFRVSVVAVACKAEIRWKQEMFDEARDLLAVALAFRDANKVDIHIMESVYLDELIKKMDLSSWERSISADQLSAILTQ